MIRILSALILIGALPSITLVAAKQSSSEAHTNYAAVRAVMVRLYDVAHSARASRASRFYALGSCQPGSAFVGNDPDRQTALYADIAYVVVHLERELPDIGYPSSVWKNRLSHFEHAMTVGNGSDYDHSLDLFLRHLRTDLEAYRTTHRTLPRTVLLEGCGAGEMAVNLVTRPKDAQIFVIPTFFYELCKVQKINPDDTTACSHWREVMTGMVTEVSGDYRYRARWHDGTIRRGKLLFDSATMGRECLKSVHSTSLGVTLPAGATDFAGCVTLRKP